MAAGRMYIAARRKKYSKRKTVSRTMTIAAKSNSITPFGSRFKTKVVYCDSGALATNASGLYFEQTYNLNSLFDPERSGIGHQPYGFSKIMGIYLRYRVYKCKYEISYTLSNTSAVPTVLSMLPTNLSLGPSTGTLACEHPNSKSSLVTTGETKHMVCTVDLPKLNGKSRKQYDYDEETAGTDLVNPNEILVLHMGLHSPTSSAGSINYHIKLTYFAEFYDPKDLPQS